jgi:hypothetical protein
VLLETLRSTQVEALIWARPSQGLAPKSAALRPRSQRGTQCGAARLGPLRLLGKRGAPQEMPVGRAVRAPSLALACSAWLVVPWKLKLVDGATGSGARASPDSDAAVGTLSSSIRQGRVSGAACDVDARPPALRCTTSSMRRSGLWREGGSRAVATFGCLHRVLGCRRG